MKNFFEKLIVNMIAGALLVALPTAGIWSFVHRDSTYFYIVCGIIGLIMLPKLIDYLRSVFFWSPRDPHIDDYKMSDAEWKSRCERDEVERARLKKLADEKEAKDKYEAECAPYDKQVSDDYLWRIQWAAQAMFEAKLMTYDEGRYVAHRYYEEIFALGDTVLQASLDRLQHRQYAFQRPRPCDEALIQRTRSYLTREDDAVMSDREEAARQNWRKITQIIDDRPLSSKEQALKERMIASSNRNQAAEDAQAKAEGREPRQLLKFKTFRRDDGTTFSLE